MKKNQIKNGTGVFPAIRNFLPYNIREKYKLIALIDRKIPIQPDLNNQRKGDFRHYVANDLDNV